MRFLSSVAVLLLSIALASAADIKYIMAFKSSANDATFKKAKNDIEGMGGSVTYEFHSAMKAIAFTVPSEDVTVLKEKDYADFVEQDKSVHTFE